VFRGADKDINMKSMLSILGFTVLGVLSGGAQAANVVNNTSVTILTSSSTPYAGYGQSAALDVNLNKYLTDFAGLNTGVGTHLDFNFGSAQTFTQIQYTDRTSSGGANGSNTLGTFDFVTQYQYTFATDASFNNVVGTFTSAVFSTPGTATSFLDFQHTDALPAITAQYVKWQVLSTIGSNPGASNFQFTVTAVPEPETYALLLAGLGLMGAIVRRRTAKAS
jgi:hypothetical protein